MTDLNYYSGRKYKDKFVREENRTRWDLYHSQLQRILDLQKDWPVLRSRVTATKCFSMRSGSTGHTGIEAYMGTSTSYSQPEVAIPSYRVLITPGATNCEPILVVNSFLPKSETYLWTPSESDLRILHTQNPKHIRNSHTPVFYENYGSFVALALLQNLFIDSLIDNKTGQTYNEWQKIAGSEMTPEELDSIIYQASQIDKIIATE
jgi:hypothetical protein